MKQSVKVKKAQITVVKHTIDWFKNRIGEFIFHRVKTPTNEVVRRYIKIESPAQAYSLYIDQNVTGKRFFQ
jgi:hypothetical protein